MFPGPTGVAIDGAGNLFITYPGIGVIRKVSPDGTATTVAGVGEGELGDGGPAANAKLDNPRATAIDSAGNLFIADTNNGRIRKVSPDGTISTVAGRSLPAPIGDCGPATSALLALGGFGHSAIGGMALDGSGNLFIADTNNHRIRKVAPDGIITTVAGTGTPGYVGNNGPATEAQLKYPLGVAVDRAGSLLIADTGNNYVRRVSPDGIMTTVHGSDSDAGALFAVAVDSAGNLFIANGVMVRRISPEGAASIVAGGGELTFEDRDGSPATQAKLYYLCGLAVDEAGNLFIADCNDGAGAHRVSPDGIIHRVALPAGGSPRGVAVDQTGHAFFSIADSDWDISGGAERIFKVSPDGSVTAIAGTGKTGYSGDGGPAMSAELAGPAGVAVDRAGNIYFEDIGNGAVRVLRPADRLNAESQGGSRTSDVPEFNRRGGRTSGR